MAFYDSNVCTGGNFTLPFTFRDDILTRVYTIKCLVHPGNYAGLPLDTALTSAAAIGVDRLPYGIGPDPNAYHIGDDRFNIAHGGLLAFDRMFSHVPQPYDEPIGVYGFTFPRVPGGIVLEKTSSSQTSSYDTGTYIVRLDLTMATADDAEQFQEGQEVTVTNPSGWDYKITSGSSNTLNRKSFTGTVISSVGLAIRVETEWFYWAFGGPGGKQAYSNFADAGTDNYTISRIVSPERNRPENVNSKARRRYRYVRSSSPDSVAVATQFILKKADGTEATETSDTTIPETTESYTARALQNDYINAEDEVPTRWKGNIWEFSQIQVVPK